MADSAHGAEIAQSGIGEHWRAIRSDIMKVLERRARLLTQAEVLEIVREVAVIDADETVVHARKYAATAGEHGSLMESKWVAKAVQEYLEERPAASQSLEVIASFFKSLCDYADLITEVEIMQLVDHQPSQLVEIHAIITACEERLSSDDTANLLQLIQNHFGCEV